MTDQPLDLHNYRDSVTSDGRHKYPASAGAQVLELVAEVERLRAEVAKTKRAAITLGHTIVQLGVTMQAAVIDARRSGDPARGMAWIENDLAGAGMTPFTREDVPGWIANEDTDVVPGETGDQFFERQMTAARADRDASYREAEDA